MRWKGIPRASVANAVRDSLWCLHRNQYHDVTCVIDPIGAASIDAPRRAATDGKTAQGNPSAVPESEPIFSSGPNRTCFEPPSLAVEQFLAMVRFEQRGKLAELPDDLVGGRDVFVLPPS